MSRLTFTVPGPPCALQRHRSAIRGKGARAFVQHYDPEANKSNKARIQQFAVLAQRDGGVKMLSGPLGLSIVARFPRPKSHYGTGKNANTLKPSAPWAHTQKPDLSNILKIVEDALNGVVWHDDSEIDSVTIHKCWTEDGGEMRVLVWEREKETT